jgi:hypothetical protein
MTGKMCTRCGHVSENATGATEDIILNLNTFIHLHVVLDANTIADFYVVAYVNILAKRATLTDMCATLDVAEMPNLSIFADDDIVINIAAFMDKWS